MNDSMPPFLDDGLSVYAKARATLTFFEGEIGKLLHAALDERAKWPFLETHKISRAKGDKTAGENGYWVECGIEAFSHRKEQVAIGCGVWWRAVDASNAVVYGCFYKPADKLMFAFPQQDQGIHSFDRFGRTHLYLPVTKSTEIGGFINMVLDELLQRLK